MNFQWVLFTVIFGIGIANCKAQDANTQRGGKIFFKSYSTRTAFSISFLTSTVPFTCFSASTSAANEKPCVGRKRRRIFMPEEFANSGIDTSITNISPSLDKNDVFDNRRKGKIIFTLWSTTTSTLTATSYVTNHSVTLSIILNCTVANSVYNLC